MLKQNGDGKDLVGKEELTKNYTKLVLAPHMSQGLMSNIVREGLRISFLKLGVNPGKIFGH